MSKVSKVSDIYFLKDKPAALDALASKRRKIKKSRDVDVYPTVESEAVAKRVAEKAAAAAASSVAPGLAEELKYQDILKQERAAMDDAALRARARLQLAPPLVPAPPLAPPLAPAPVAPAPVAPAPAPAPAPVPAGPAARPLTKRQIAQYKNPLAPKKPTDAQVQAYLVSLGHVAPAAPQLSPAQLNAIILAQGVTGAGLEFNLFTAVPYRKSRPYPVDHTGMDISDGKLSSVGKNVKYNINTAPAGMGFMTGGFNELA